MSWDTQAWAAKIRAGSPAAKLVLVALASCADDDHCAYPSVAWISEFSELNRKTVIAALDRLETAGLITDTGDRKGRTGQVKIYRLQAERVSKEAPLERVPETGLFPAKGPTFSAKGSQKRDTEPSLEPSKKATASPSLSRVSDTARVVESFAAWNALQARLWPTRRNAAQTDLRRRQMRARLVEVGEQGWIEALSKVEASPFLRGEQSSFSLGIDWLLKPANLTKVLEGNYDQRARAGSRQPGDFSGYKNNLARAAVEDVWTGRCDLEL